MSLHIKQNIIFILVFGLLLYTGYVIWDFKIVSDNVLAHTCWFV